MAAWLDYDAAIKAEEYRQGDAAIAEARAIGGGDAEAAWAEEEVLSRFRPLWAPRQDALALLSIATPETARRALEWMGPHPDEAPEMMRQAVMAYLERAAGRAEAAPRAAFTPAPGAGGGDRRILELFKQFKAAYFAPPSTPREEDEIQRDMEHLAAEIEGIPATTAAGFAAKALVAMGFGDHGGAPSDAPFWVEARALVEGAAA